MRMKLILMEIDFLWKMEGINNLACPATSALMYEGQSISNASYLFFSFTFQENSNTIT